MPVAAPQGTFVVQVVGDRAEEQRTLAVLLAVLVRRRPRRASARRCRGRQDVRRPGAGPDPRRDAPPAGVRRRRQPRAADAARGRQGQRRRPPPPPRPARRARSVTRSTTSRRATDRLTALVDDLLVLARTDSGAVELDLRSDRPRGPRDRRRRRAGRRSLRRAASRARIDAEPVPLDGDAARLRQLVVILVDNAIRHASAGGGPSVSVSVRGLDGRAVLTVDDDGPGIRTEDLPHVFDRFWRAPGAPEGAPASASRSPSGSSSGTAARSLRPTDRAAAPASRSACRRLPVRPPRNLQSRFTASG